MRIYRDHHLAHQALHDALLELQCGLALRRRISDHMAELDLDRFRLRSRDGHDEAKRGEAAEKNAHVRFPPVHPALRSEEHTSELQSLMRISYAVFCLKTKNNTDS